MSRKHEKKKLIFDSLSMQTMKNMKNSSWSSDSHDQYSETDIRDRKRSNSYNLYHKEVEKQRRMKMNEMLKEISALNLIGSGSMQRLDKLKILELTVLQMKEATKSKNNALPKQSIFKPPYLSDGELKNLLEQSSQGFLLVLSCDDFEVLYVSNAISTTTNYTGGDLTGKKIVDFLYEPDVEVLVQNLSLHPLITKALEHGQENEFFVGMKRSFTFRLKNKNEDGNTIVKCNGFLKAGHQREKTKFYFVGIATHIRVKETRCMSIDSGTAYQFVSHHSADFNFLYVDQRMVCVTGYLPNDLLGRNKCDYIHPEDKAKQIEHFQLVLNSADQERIVSDVYRFRIHNEQYILMRTVAFSLLNPFTNELEFVFNLNLVLG